MTIEQILAEAERRRQMFHWFIDGLGSKGHLTPDGRVLYMSRHGISWRLYNSLTPDWVTKNYNIEI